MRKIGNLGYIIIEIVGLILTSVIGQNISPEAWWVLPLFFLGASVVVFIAKHGISGWLGRKKFKEKHTEVLTEDQGRDKIKEHMINKDMREVHTTPKDGGFEQKITTGERNIPFWVKKTKVSVSRDPPYLTWIVCDLSTGAVVERNGDLTIEQLEKILDKWGGPVRYMQKIQQPAQPQVTVSTVPVTVPEKKEEVNE